MTATSIRPIGVPDVMEGLRPQIVHVTVDRGYWPTVIRAKARLPLRVVFHRFDASECAERVVFSSPRLERRLELTTPTTVDLPAQPPGQVLFTCGMGRFSGRIELTDRPVSVLGRLSAQLKRIDRPIGAALVLWIFSLPLIAPLAMSLLDARATLVAAGAALMAWSIGCVLAFGRAERRKSAVPRTRHWRFR